MRSAEQREGVFLTPGLSPVYPGLAAAWCSGAEFTELVRTWDMAEGDAIRYLKKTADLLRQVIHALEGTGYKPELREIAREAEALVRRDIVRGQELADLEELEDVPEVEAAIEAENASLAEAEKAAEAHLTPPGPLPLAGKGGDAAGEQLA